MTTDTATLTGLAAAFATAQLAGDGEAVGLLADWLPRPLGATLPHVLADAAVLLRDSVYASVSLAIHRQADDIDVVAAWEGAAPTLAATIAEWHGFTEDEVTGWLDWAAGVLLRDDMSVPACNQAKCLVLTTSFIAEEFAGYPLEEWQRFLVQREASHG